MKNSKTNSTTPPGSWSKRQADLFDRNYFRFSLLIGGSALGVFIYWSEKRCGKLVLLEVLQNNRSAVYSALATIFGSLFGFVITAVSVVLTISGSERLNLVRNSPHYEALWKSFTNTIRVLGLATLLVLAALVLDRDTRPRCWLTYSVLGCCLLSLLMLGRSVWALERVISLITDQAKLGR